MQEKKKLFLLLFGLKKMEFVGFISEVWRFEESRQRQRQQRQWQWQRQQPTVDTVEWMDLTMDLLPKAL